MEDHRIGVLADAIEVMAVVAIDLMIEDEEVDIEAEVHLVILIEEDQGPERRLGTGETAAEIATVQDEEDLELRLDLPTEIHDEIREIEMITETAEEAVRLVLVSFRVEEEEVHVIGGLGRDRGVRLGGGKM